MKANQLNYYYQLNFTIVKPIQKQSIAQSYIYRIHFGDQIYQLCVFDDNSLDSVIRQFVIHDLGVRCFQLLSNNKDVFVVERLPFKPLQKTELYTSIMDSQFYRQTMSEIDKIFWKLMEDNNLSNAAEIARQTELFLVTVYTIRECFTNEVQ